MRDQPPVELAGKAQRVLGVFLYMVGAGLMLECAAYWIGSLLLLIGVGVFARGAWVARDAQRTTADLRVRSHGQPTEGHL